MKVLVIHCSYRDPGGEEVLVASEINLLKSAAIEVDFLEFKNPYGRIKSALIFLSLPFNVISFAITIKKLRDFKPNVVHLHNWHFAASPSVIVACNILKIPIVLSLHNFRLLCPSGVLFHNDRIFLDSLRQLFPWTAVGRGVYHNSVTQTFWLALTVFVHRVLGTWSRVASYIVNSDFERSIIISSTLGVPEEKIKIKANSLPEPKFDSSIKRDKHYLFIGRFVAEKGVLVLIEAFAKAKSKLIIFGYGPLEEKIKFFSERYDNIEYKGSLPHNKMSDELRKCTALVFPSTWFEGMPMTLVHAFSTGTPVLASKIGAMETMVVDQQNGLHFRTGDHDDLVAAVHRWSGMDESARRDYQLRSREMYETIYSPKANLRNLNNIYRDALGLTSTSDAE